MTKYELAHLAWPILVKAAAEQSTLSYGDLAAQIGRDQGNWIRWPLDAIQSFCLERGLPPITSLVLNPKTGSPGQGFVAGTGNLAEDHKAVFAHNWQSVQTPFPPQLLDGKGQPKPTSQPTTSSHRVDDEVVTVNGRGPYQSMFRQALLRAYRSTCALCDTRLASMLVASHIVPWSEDRDNRLNPRNGLLLCRNHDGLFESGAIRLKEDYSVQATCLDEEELGVDLLRFLREGTRAELKMPIRGNEPDPAFLAWRLQTQD